MLLNETKTMSSLTRSKSGLIQKSAHCVPRFQRVLFLTLVVVSPVSVQLKANRRDHHNQHHRAPDRERGLEVFLVREILERQRDHDGGENTNKQRRGFRPVSGQQGHTRVVENEMPEDECRSHTISTKSWLQRQ